jgi:hypothetical protein
MARILVATFMLAGLAAASTNAPPPLADTERYKTAIADGRRKLFAEAMSGLSAEQLESFWSIYADFEREKNEIAAARVDLVKRFADHFRQAGLSDENIKDTVSGLSTLHKDVIDLRMKYFDLISQRVDSKTAGRFALVDDFVTTSIRLDWLNQIPFPGDE